MPLHIEHKHMFPETGVQDISSTTKNCSWLSWGLHFLSHLFLSVLCRVYHIILCYSIVLTCYVPYYLSLYHIPFMTSHSLRRAVFRALTRLRAATIKEFDTIARLETQAGGSGHGGGRDSAGAHSALPVFFKSVFFIECLSRRTATFPGGKQVESKWTTTSTRRKSRTPR